MQVNKKRLEDLSSSLFFIIKVYIITSIQPSGAFIVPS